jgi:TRAP-type transport system periplasmic protein
MKRLTMLLVGVLVIITTLLMGVGCSPAATPAPSAAAPSAAAPAATSALPAPTSAPAATAAAPAAGAKAIELKVNIAWSSTSYQNEHFTRLKAKLESASNGRLTLRIYPGSTLVPERELWDGVTKGLCDIVGGSRYETRGADFMNNILYFAIGIQNAKMGASVAKDLYNQFPEFQKEWSTAKLLYFAATGPNHIISASKPVKSLDDLKNMQIRSGPSGGMPELLKQLGASPVSLPAGEVYTGLQKKTVEGCSFPAEALKTFRIGEVVKYMNTINLWAMPCNFVAMNFDSYNKLPADLQKVIDDNMAWASDDLNGAFNDGDQQGIDFAKAQGMQLVDVTDADKWYSTIEPLQAQVAKDLDAKGLPGTKFKEYIKQRIDFYNKK